MSPAEFLFESKPEERAFNKRYSRFKVVFYFKDGKMKGKPVTYYGKEKYRITVLQIDHGHYKKILLDRAAGLAHCQRLVDHYAGKYQTAIVFDRRKNTITADGVEETGREVMKFIDGQLMECESDILPAADQKIICNVVHKEKKWNLVPVADPSIIDFKKEIKNVLNKTNS